MHNFCFAELYYGRKAGEWQKMRSYTFNMHSSNKECDNKQNPGFSHDGFNAPLHIGTNPQKCSP